MLLDDGIECRFLGTMATVTNEIGGVVQTGQRGD